MKEFKHDDERLAALLGGRLDGPEREELLAHLLADDEDYQVFADTAAILQEAEAEDAARASQAGERVVNPLVRTTAPPSTRSGWRGTPRRLVIFTALVGLVASVTFLSQGRAGPAETPLQVADRLGAAELPPDRMDAQVGTKVRGGDGPANAAAAGARLVRLAIAIQAGDAAATERLATALKEHDETGGAALDSIAAHAGQADSTLRPLLAQATDRLEQVTDRDALRLGAWTEGAIIAAKKQDAAFFKDDATDRMLRRAEKLDDNAEARTAVQSVRAALPQGGPPEWGALDASLSGLLAAITTR